MKRVKGRRRKLRGGRKAATNKQGAPHTFELDSGPIGQQPLAEAESPNESSVGVVAYDAELLERALAQWRFADWDSLCKITRTILEYHPDRATLALLAAAAHFHRTDVEAVREYVGLAQKWGCSKQVVAQMLLAGVHDTLGRAAAASGQELRALSHFEAAVSTATPAADVPHCSRARLAQQQDQLGVYHSRSRAWLTKPG